MIRVRYDEDTDAEVVRQHQLGHCPAYIGKLVGRTEKSVSGRLRALGVTERDRSSRSDAAQRRDDEAFVCALAKAFMRGDHLPAAQRLAA